MNENTPDSKPARQRGNILEETSENIFHTLAIIIASVFKTEIAFIQINAEQEIFYANTGEASAALKGWKEQLLYTIINQTKELVIIEDVSADSRLLHNNFLGSSFTFRSFAGMPLTTNSDDYVGCICLLHNEVKIFSDADKLLLMQFASVVVNEMEIRKAAGISFTNYQQQVAKGVKDLASSNESLYNSNQELERFVYVTSHDLQEPVRKIKTFINILKNKLNDKAAVETYLHKVLSSADRLSDLITALLDYSRSTNSNIAFVITDLNQILQTVLQDYEVIITQKKAVIESGQLPMLPVIPIQIYQLFSNLLSNALKFSTGNTVITITCSVAKAEEVLAHHLNPLKKYVCVVFKDNGIGFAQENEKKIFELFQRLNGNAEYPGTGMGLAICKRIIQNHDGAIYVKSASGEGAAFSVFLPMTDEIL